jgi:ureidoacrylate peracid hydrolase
MGFAAALRAFTQPILARTPHNLSKETNLHHVQISDAVLRRVMDRRGKRHVFDRIDSKRTALIVVDMQNGFTQPGAISEVAAARDIIPNINRMADELRSKGGRVVWLQHTTDDRANPEQRNIWLEAFSPDHLREEIGAAFRQTSSQHQINPLLKVDPQDDLVCKYRYSAFTDGSSRLREVLRSHGVDTLIITGTLTNVCCESTAREGMMLGYEVHFLSDATATRSDDEHNATLNALIPVFCDVRSTNEVIGLLAES